MKVTADKKYLKEVLDKAEFALMYTIGSQKTRESAEDSSSEVAKDDVTTALHYFNYLGVKSLEDEEFAEELQETLKELVKEGTLLKEPLAFLYQFVQIGRWVRHDPEDNPGVEALEKDFDNFFNRVPIEKVRENKKALEEFIDSLPDEKEDKLANRMYG